MANEVIQAMNVSGQVKFNEDTLSKITVMTYIDKTNKMILQLEDESARTVTGIEKLRERIDQTVKRRVTDLFEATFSKVASAFSDAKNTGLFRDPRHEIQCFVPKQHNSTEATVTVIIHTSAGSLTDEKKLRYIRKELALLKELHELEQHKLEVAKELAQRKKNVDRNNTDLMKDRIIAGMGVDYLRNTEGGERILELGDAIVEAQLKQDGELKCLPAPKNKRLR